jgi:uncharacterized membrane protein YphA (DoxX/SURF4 family)
VRTLFRFKVLAEVLTFRLNSVAQPYTRGKIMYQFVQGPLSVLGRLLLATIFFMAAVGNKIPHFSEVAKVMVSAGVPAPQLLLVGAIIFLIAGSLSVIVGYHARIGATLLLAFLVLASTTSTRFGGSRVRHNRK